MSLECVLDEIDSNFEIKKEYDLSSLVNWSGNGSKPIHRWYKYREAYSPELIDRLKLGPKILDPFCGCGSIMIGAAERNLLSVGVDINPLAVFATKVKMTPLSKDELERVSNFKAKITGDKVLGNVKEWPMPGLSISEKVFEPQIYSTLMKLRRYFEEEFSTDKNCLNFIKLGWLSILETVGSYYKEGNGIKYRNKKRYKGKYQTRPEGEWQLERFGVNQTKFTIDSFTNQLDEMIEDCSHWKNGSWNSQKAFQGSSRELDAIPTEVLFDSVVFSPPYANRFDYFESLKVELWFGNFINSYAEGQKFRKLSTRSHLGANLKLSARKFPQLESLISYMDKDTTSWKMGIESLLYGYFDDMYFTLKQCHSLLSSSGSCHVVVGNSAFAGVIIPTDSLIALLGVEAGFKSVSITEARHLTVSPQQRKKLLGYEKYMRESIVSFQK